MNELTLTIEFCDWINHDILNYLSSINGVLEVKIFEDENKIYLHYDQAIISIKLLKMEILLYLSLSQKPSVIAFDKHSKNKTISTSIIIKDLCCEFCLKSMIEELLLINGIECAYPNYDYQNNKNIIIYINYDHKIITNKKIIELENKFNSY